MSIFMHPYKIAGLFTFGILINTSSSAKIQNYTYSDELCEYKTQYNDRVVTLKQVKDSLTLYSLAQSSKLDPQDSAYSLHNPPTNQIINHFTAQYHQRKTYIQTLIPVKAIPYQQLKSTVLRQLNHEYEMYNFKLLAFQNPKILLNQRYGQKCYAIAQRMNLKGQALINASRSLLLEEIAQARKEGLQHPTWYQEQIDRFDYEIRQTNHKTSYAFDRLMFHWHNCAVAATPNDEAQIAKLNPQKDLFVKSKASCDY